MDTDSSLVDFNWAEALDQLIQMLDNDIMEDDRDHDDHDSSLSTPPFTLSNFISTPLPEQQSPPFTPSNFISTPLPEQESSPFTPSNFVTTPLPEQQPSPFTPSNFISTTPLSEQHRAPVDNPTSSEVDNSTGILLLSELVDDKLSRALLLCKEWFGKGSLAQVWVPIKTGEKIMLSTSDHLFFLQDDTLSGYRQASRLFSIAAEPRAGSFSDLPSRVFFSKVPEWTNKVSCYDSEEFLRMHHAVEHKVCGSLALPVFEDDAQTSCRAVLELVTTHERPNFDAEMDATCKALQAVELSSSRPPRLDSQSLSLLQNAALGEIKGILYAICHAHQLPLALTWVPWESSGGCEVDFIGRNGNKDPNQKSILCVDETACYWQDKHMEGFVRACTTRPLQQGQGIVGKSLQSNEPLFHPDVKQLHITDYPLVHHARRFGLCAAIAIRITSAYTGADDYIMEFFLPVDMKGASEQESMIDNIASTIVRIYRRLKKVPDIQLLEEKDFKVEMLSRDLEENDIPPAAVSATTSEESVIDDMVDDDMPEVVISTGASDQSVVDDKVDSDSNASKTVSPEIKDNAPPGEAAVVGKLAKRKIANDRGITVSQLEPYFSESITHAAKCLGVAPNTIKRVCRQNGITRWPSRKINKINLSLKKIQDVLESVQGVPGGLVFDPTSGKLLGSASMIQVDLSDKICLDKPQPSAANAPKRRPGKNKAPAVEPGSTSLNSPLTSGGDEWTKYLMSED